MTMLVIDELRSTLEQELQVADRLNLESVRLKIYLHNDPAGTFTLSVKEGSTTLSSASLTMAEIKTQASLNDNEYHWGMLRFDLNEETVLNKDVTYTLELSASGYTFSESAYIGWIKEHEDETNTFEARIGYDYSNPFSYQLWGY